MADSVINIIINTMKKGVGDKDTQNALKQVGNMFQRATGFSLSYAGAATAAVAVGKKLYDITKQSVNEYIAEANSIEKLVSLTGSRADELSRLVQVADDAKLSEESLEKAMEGATRKGTDVSIESIAALSDEYLKLNPGLDRANFLTQKFGKSGTEMYKIMQLGSKAIKDQSAAVNSSLIITQKDIDASNKLQKSKDDLNDSWTAVKNNIARAVIPTLQKLLDKEVEHIRYLDLQKEKNNGVVDGYQRSLGYSKELVQQAKEQTEAIKDQSQATDDLTAGTDALNSEMADLSQKYKDISGLAQNLYQNEQSLKTAEKDLYDYQKSHPWDTTGIKDRQQAVEDLRTAQQQMVDEWLLNVYTQMLTADGDLSESDMQFLLNYQVNTGMIDQATADRAKAYYDYAQQVIASNGDMQASIDALHGKTIVIDVKVNNQAGTVTVNGMGVANLTGINNQSGQGYNYDEKKALGGDVYAGVPILVGEKGPEVYIPNEDGVIVPNSYFSNTSSPTGIGGGAISIVNYVSVSGVSDPEKAADLAIKKLERKLALQLG
jgi:hypothetical protein